MVGVFAKSPSGPRSSMRRSKNFLELHFEEHSFEIVVYRERSPLSKREPIQNSSPFMRSMTETNGEDRVGSKRISPAAALQTDKPFDSFQPIELAEEPVEHDQPIPCPMPEPSIMEDGILWRARILESLRRRNDINLTPSKERQSVIWRGGSTPNRRTQSRSMDNFLLEAHSAPEVEVRKLLE